MDEPRFGAALVRGSDLASAVHAAAVAALLPLDGAPVTLAAAFVCGDDPDAVERALATAQELLGAEHLIGCSTGGVLGDGQGVEGTPAVSVWVASLPDASVRSFHLEVLRTDTEVAVLGMPERRDDENVAVLLADPWSFPVDGFLEGSAQAMPGLGYVGGFASGPGGPGATRLLVDGRVVGRGAVGVMIGGGARVRPLVSQGCRPVGPDMVVTRAEGSDILELAGVPALERLESLVAGLDPAEQQLVMSGLQLGIALDEYAESHGHGDFLIRALLGADRETGALRIGDNVTVGQTVRFHARDAQAADADLRHLLETRTSNVAGALVFSCNGRGAGLFGSADHDAAVVAEVTNNPAVAGFFAAGELGPVGGSNYLHSFTASMLLFAGGPS